MMNHSLLISGANRWRDGYNPLRGLTMARAVTLMEAAQRGVMADLQWLYASELGIEATDPDLMTIIERTVSGISDMDWQIITADERQRGYDPVLAQEQQAFLEESYTACDNLREAIEHLAMARFRGFSHLSPWTRADGSLEHLEPLPQWNMVRNGTRNEWAWNPAAEQTGFAELRSGRPLSPEEYILCENRRPVNRIALIKHIRSTIAEKDWDAYVEIYGIPGVFVIMPPNIPEGKEREYADRAAEAAEAASGALPNGSDVRTLSEVRGSQPFSMRLEWLQKQLVLAGTGGMLTMLSEPAGLGNGASNAQSTVWETIVRRLARRIEEPMNRQYDRRALSARFPGRPALAFFSLRARQEKDLSGAVDSITRLSAAGYRVDPKQVSEETGYRVTLFEPSPVQAQPMLHARQCQQDGLAKAKAAQPKGIENLLMELARTVLDGSIPFEEALKRAQSLLENADIETLSAPLERKLEQAMFQAAADAAEGDNR